MLLALAAFLILAYRKALGLPFLNDDYLILDKVSRSSFPDLWAPRELIFNWYRPWSREFHYWLLLKSFGLNETAYHLVSFGLWLVVMALYFALVRKLVGSVAAATVATVGLSVLALWSAPLLWIAGVQDLWMLIFALLFLHAVIRGWNLRALLPLSLALLSKETAAALPLVATAYLWIVNRCSLRQALRKTWPQWALLLVWIAIHPTLTARFFGPLQHSMETERRPDVLFTLLKTLYAQFNLDARPAPEAGWFMILQNAAVGGALLGTVLMLGMRPKSQDPSATTRRDDERRILVFGGIWTVAGWAILFLPSIGWHAYYGSLGSLGFWLVLGTLLSRKRRLALAMILVLVTLREARAATPSWDWGTYWYQKRAGSFLSAIRSRLNALHPTLPAHSRLFFAGVPNNIGLLAADGPAIRIWYRDPTLRAMYFSKYFPRTPADSLGGDFFFLYDPAKGLTELIANPESTDPDLQRTPAWMRNQLLLASLFLRSGNLRGAAVSYVKLWRTFPRHGEYALYAATLYDAAGDSSEAGNYYRVANSALGTATVLRVAPRLVAAARDSAQAAADRPMR